MKTFLIWYRTSEKSLARQIQ